MKIKKIRKFIKINNKKLKRIEFGVVHILSSFNNTIVNITDNFGNTISWCTTSTGGLKNFKNPIISAQLAAEISGKKAMSFGLKNVNVVIKGIGNGRDPALKGLINIGLKIFSICDITPIPHNGCKPRKIRRI